MADNTSRSRRDAALRAVLVQRAKAERSRQRTTASSGGGTGRRLPMLATAVVLVAIVALSAGAIAAGQSRFAVASKPLMSVPTQPAESASPSSSPTPSSTPSVPLIAMDGAGTLTRTQLHTWTLANRGDSPNAVIGEEQDWIKIQCMAEYGYLYDPTFEGNQGLELGKTWGLTTKQLQGYRDALWGSNLNSSNTPYDWHDAGCDGRAVHLTGQDNNH